MNTDYFDKIESYLQREMSADERTHFEKEMAADEELSSAFKMYNTIEFERRSYEQNRSAQIALKNTLQGLGKTYFSAEAKAPAKVVTMNRSRFYKMTASIAACFLLIVAGYFVFFQSTNNAQQLAEDYTKNNCIVLSHEMGVADSMQSGLDLHNKKEYSKALEIFKEIYQRDTTNTDALKYIGIVYLVTKDYNKALQYFSLLSERKNLFSNPGKFHIAQSLLLRNHEGDKAQAKQLLQQVVQEKAEGSETAVEWLKSL